MARFTLLTFNGSKLVCGWFLASALAGCALPKVLGDSPVDGSSDSGGSEGGSDGSGSLTTGAPAGSCDDPDFTCQVPVDCAAWDCGAPGSPFDAAGCLRPSCTDGPCAADEICYAVSKGECGQIDVVGCGDVDGVCACEFDPACGDNHCIPADEGPPVECPAIVEEAACLAAGCSEFTTVGPWTVVDGECVQGPSEPLCMWFPGDAWGGTATPGSFYEKATGKAVRFGTDWIDPPHGWGDCGDPEAPPACECIGVCALAQKDGDSFLENDLPCESVSDCVLVDAVCYAGNTCGSVAVNQASAEEWSGIEANLGELGCCAGADPCGASVACEDQRCVVKFP